MYGDVWHRDVYVVRRCSTLQMLIICYLPLLSMGTIALPSIAVCRAVCVNATIEINVLNYNVAVGPSSTYSEFVM